MSSARWVVGVGALLVAAAALFVLLAGDGAPRGGQPALDDIDPASRSAMRDLLRDAEKEE